ncbi:hypothetical protein LP419_09135 [Massilia sp. H-1]|nr:hypothetical protein LP419_09135 [Massilia sp. H-1]
MPGGLDGPAAQATFDTPTALVLDARGTIYVADARLGAIRRIGADGQVATLALSDPEADDAAAAPAAVAGAHARRLSVHRRHGARPHPAARAHRAAGRADRHRNRHPDRRRGVAALCAPG